VVKIQHVQTSISQNTVQAITISIFGTWTSFLAEKLKHIKLDLIIKFIKLMCKLSKQLKQLTIRYKSY
jgi:hypothetical protein